MELREYWNVVRKYLWLIALTTAVAGGVAFYVSATSPPTYKAAATIEINPASDPLNDRFSYYTAYAVEQAAQNLSAKVESPPFLQEVQTRLGLEEGIEGSVIIEQIGETQFVRISAQSGSPALAQALANTVAQVLIEREAAQQQARFQEGLAELETQIQALETSIADTRREIASLGSPEDDTSEFVRQERSRLESKLNRDETRLVVFLNSAEEFRMAMARYTDYISIYAEARLPETPIGPPQMRNTALGGVTGLMIGVSIAFLLEYLDDTIRSPEDVKRTLPVGLLGAIPRLPARNGRVALVVADHPLQPIAEAFRKLRTSVQFSSLDRPARTLLVTSPLPTDGKTFTAANLAAVMAQGGRSVVLVDADLRHPMQHRMFELPREPGLATALLSPEGRTAVLQQTEVDGLRVVTGGPHVPNPAELLASERMDEFVAWLHEQTDVVIVDSPPVLAVTDAAVLSNLADATLLVVDSGQTRRPVALQAVERLTGVGGKVLGVVLNRLSPSHDGYYHYYYPYYGGADGRGRRNGRGNGWLGRILGSGRGRDRNRAQTRESEEMEARR